MRHQSGEGKNAKKGPKVAVETGFDEWPLWKKAVEEAHIKPAEFFDPKEFGNRRKITSPRE
jgi:hypothetical protein